MKKNTKKKFRDIRNAVVMMCVMVAMMSTASYAWFTMTSSPTVTGMQMTAAATSGLQISLDNTADSYKDAVIVVEDDSDAKVLKPVTLVAKESVTKYSEVGATEYIKFKEAVYSGKDVTGLTEVPGADITGCVAKYTIYLKGTDPNATGQYGIGIICGARDNNGDFTLNGTTPTTAGSVVKATGTTSGQTKADYAIRVGLLPEGETDLIVWEPNNNDVTIAGATSATVTGSLSIVDDPDVGSADTGVITTGVGNPNNTSVSLFDMDKVTAKKVDIFIWLEGSDDHCVDQIQTDDIAAQIQFTVVEEIDAP